MWLGSWKNRADKPLGLDWQESLKILGIHFTYKEELGEKLNFDKLIPSMVKTLNLWKQRKLTLYGKIVVIKALLLSKLVYKESLLHVPHNIIKEVNKLVFGFLWNGPDKVKRKTVYGDYESGS